jgi:hypothetical protein
MRKLVGFGAGSFTGGLARTIAGQTTWSQ